MSYRENAAIISTACLADGVYEMWLKTEKIAKESRPGQFISVYSNDGSRLLPRPISICRIDDDKLRIVYRIAGKGTKEFSQLVAGDTVDILGPLGNGFMKSDKKAILIGGGIGIPPMLQLAKELDCEKSVVLGYRDEIFLNEEFEPYAHVYMSSEDGQHGVKGNVIDGNVIDAIKQENIEAGVFYACGPAPMLRGLKMYAEDKGTEAQISLEEKMACGIGACLACVCKTKDIDEHSQVHNRRICKDGPVFYAEEVEL